MYHLLINSWSLLPRVGPSSSCNPFSTNFSARHCEKTSLWDSHLTDFSFNLLRFSAVYSLLMSTSWLMSNGRWLQWRCLCYFRCIRVELILTPRVDTDRLILLDSCLPIFLCIWLLCILTVFSWNMEESSWLASSMSPCWHYIWGKVFKNGSSKICGRQVCLSRSSLQSF